MKLKKYILLLLLSMLYLTIIFFGVFFNYKVIENSKDININNKNMATLVDCKGNFIVYNKKMYEAWIDLSFLRRQKKFKEYEHLLLSKYTQDEIKDKKFLKWGKFYTKKEAEDNLGVLRKFSKIYETQDRIYNDLFSLSQLIGKYDKTNYGIEKYLYNNKLLETQKEQNLSIDLTLQRILYEELKKTVKEKNASGAVALIMNTKTGEIKASVSIYPWNMGYMGYIEPGSTLKPMIYAMAIDENIIKPYETFKWSYQYTPKNTNIKIKESEYFDLGTMDIKTALAHSSNVAIAKVMEKILNTYSQEWLYNSLLKMGFGKKTNIEFSGEIDGVLKNPDEWKSITPYQIAIGQGIGVTPIQLITAFNAIVNNGYYVYPTFFKNKKVFGRQIYSERTSKKLLDWMRYTTILGTAKDAYKEGLLIGGKTGTAQKALKGIGYTKEDYYSLFEGYYPSINPEYTFLIIVDDPKGEYYGGEVAAPIITNVFYNYSKRKEVYNYLGYYFKGVLPNLINFDMEEAKALLINLGYNFNKIIITGSGTKVTYQYPNPGTLLKDTQYIELRSD
ncbi:penicillin-binding protein 2 [Tepiditoga spiralis]|uniref:Penicillin-binding protein 2 n=1 Tax=Tepiditoga spiralis TaxID=2108365 RepID=A0A7G1G6U0_9BACT|nr:penicillin-binding transpeptidase domain-containing protein [Tepiditoga spiralis]BBE31905.1 penicillin-binding protein 2 [Tepiditoga spiralis]